MDLQDCFPRLYVAASLKLQVARDHRLRHGEFSAALCRGLIEAVLSLTIAPIGRKCFPRLYVAASLKLHLPLRRQLAAPERFPRLYVAASLKRDGEQRRAHRDREFSAALCRGLIEATW